MPWKPITKLRNYPITKSPIWLKLARHWIVRVGIVIKPLLRLPAIPAGHDQPLQQWRRSKTPFLEFVKHHLADVIGGIETDKIQQRKRAHGITAAQLNEIVDMRDRSHTIFVSADGVNQIEQKQPDNNDARRVHLPHPTLAQTCHQ